MTSPRCIELPLAQLPEFGEACVGCNTATAGRTVVVQGRWCLGVRRARCDAPMCAPCELARIGRQRLRAWHEIVGLAAATLAATGLVPHLGGVTERDVLLDVGLFLVVMLPFWILLTTMPLAFSLRVTPEAVGYVFTDGERAAAFAAKNGVTGPLVARRARRAILVALATTVVLALLSRRYPLPGLLAEHTGDALYATAAFFLLALAAPGVATARLGLAAVAFATLVEASQLLAWPWLVALRQTSMGALLLGHGFQLADLFAYALGGALGCVADATFLRRSSRAVARPDRVPNSPMAPDT